MQKAFVINEIGRLSYATIDEGRIVEDGDSMGNRLFHSRLARVIAMYLACQESSSGRDHEAIAHEANDHERPRSQRP